MGQPDSADGLDPEPETIVEIAYIQAFKRLSARLSALALAVVVAAGTGGYATWKALTATHKVAAERSQAHDDTQAQIAELACGVVDQIPPDHGLADKIRVQYKCGPYKPPKAVVQPKPGHG